MNLLSLDPKGKHVFVGDTHGDLEASKIIFNEYLKPGNTLLFLGDYVDRGPQSKENIDFLLKIHEQYPLQIHLLKGNHETYNIKPFWPADFWMSLNKEETQKYSKIFQNFPLAASIGKILTLHGALPDITNIQKINQIKTKDDNWEKIIWGDFDETLPQANYIGSGGRSKVGENYFNRIMNQIDKKILIRAHQPECSEKIFNNQCLTIFTSCAYEKIRNRTIAIADFNKKKTIETINDLIIKEI